MTQRGPIITEKNRQIVSMYKAGHSSTVVAEQFGVSPATVCYTLRKLGIKRRNKGTQRVPPHDKIKMMYLNGLNSGEIALKIGLPRLEVLRSLRKHNVPRRSGKEAQKRFSLNDLAFRDITPESAYWAGFLMADGCISVRDIGSKHLICVLSSTDHSHLKKLKAFLGFAGNISTRQVYSEKGIPYKVSRLDIASDAICDDLARFGVIPQKKYRECVSLLQDSRDFWRGYVDGDGSLRINKRDQPIVELCGSEVIIKQFISFLSQHEIDYECKLYKTGPIRHFKVANERARQIAKLLYEDASVYLDRKYKLALRLMNMPPHKRNQHSANYWKQRPSLRDR